MSNSNSSPGRKPGHYDSIYVTDADTMVTEKGGGCCGCLEPACRRAFPSGFCAELGRMVRIAWPIVCTQVFQMLLGPISLIFCGHLGDPIKLDGAALAVSMINATCIAVGQGLGTACDTYFSQTFGGENKKKVGVYLQKALLFYLLAFCCCVSLHINMELILVLFGQNPEVAKIAGDYMVIFIPGALGFFMYIVLTKYVQNQNIVIPNVIIGITANGVNAILHYVFLYQLNMGPRGSAIAQAVSYVLMFFLTLTYILVSRMYKDTWAGWSWDCLQDWGRFARLAIPGMFMVCLEWWGFEIGVFLTGLLGTTELGAQSVLLQIDSIWFQIPLGIQIACSIRVGQYLGSGSALGAVTAARLSILLVFVVSLVVAIAFIALQYQLPYLFTNVEDIAQLTGQLLPIVVLYMFFDGLATACKGVLYGTGRQIIGAALLFVSYYVLALPIGIPLMFLTTLRSAAYWWALAGNLVLQASVLFALVWRTDWAEHVTKAQERAGMMGESAFEEDTEAISEETALLPKSPDPLGRRLSRRRLVSASLTKSQISKVMISTTDYPVSKILWRRLVAVVIVLCVLVAGVVIKLLVDPANLSAQTTGRHNVTSLPENVTSLPENVTSAFNVPSSTWPPTQ